MAERGVQRRLAAILAADVAGYTRLMEQDTDGTVAAWQDAREDVIKPVVADHQGTVVKLTGDGFLVEFPTVQNAVNCALILQSGLTSSILDFRMGVNLGDIVDDGEDIHGDGVNVAARLEGLAEPGGICISGMVYESIRNRIDADYEDMGPKDIKNVSAPVQAYAVRAKSVEGAKIYQTSEVSSSRVEDPSNTVSDKPSIAVLPFDNLSSDPEQESFADGMTEDLITDLSKISGLFVVARNSSYIYKDQIVDIRKVAEELGVRYVLEGSVRKAGEKVRINAQLIDGETGGHVWADRYDGTVHDVFELQDEVCAKVVLALEVQLSEGEEENLQKVHTRNLEAYELFVQARATPYPPIPERINMAREMFEKVIELDPEFAGGYAGVSSMLSFGAL
jgi:adenylate cyclase